MHYRLHDPVSSTQTVSHMVMQKEGKQITCEWTIDFIIIKIFQKNKIAFCCDFIIQIARLLGGN